MGREENHAPASQPGFIDEKQLLVRLPVSRGTLANWKRKGVLPFIKIGRRCLYDWASVQSALLRRQHGGQGDDAGRSARPLLTTPSGNGKLSSL